MSYQTTSEGVGRILGTEEIDQTTATRFRELEHHRAQTTHQTKIGSEWMRKESQLEDESYAAHLIGIDKMRGVRVNSGNKFRYRRVDRLVEGI